jgi:hypothetical protein
MLLGWLSAFPRFGGRLLRHGAPGRRVLVLEPFGLGDVLSHQPMVHALLAGGFQVTFCGREAFRAMLPPEVQWIPSRIPWGLHDYARKYRPADYLAPEFRGFFRALRGAGRGAIGLDTRGDCRSVWLLHLSGCARVLTLDHYLDTDLPMPRVAGERVPFDFSLRRWELNLRFPARLGVETGVAGPPALDASHWAQARASSASEIALIPMAPWEGKLWPVQHWRSLVKALRAVGHAPCALCGPGQTSATLAQLGGAVPVREQGSIPEWLRVLAQFRAVISVDTGPMHLADALGVPVVALYGVGRLPLWQPSGANSIALHHQDDPDFRQLAPTNANAAGARSFLARITAREVTDALDRLGCKVAAPL